MFDNILEGGNIAALYYFRAVMIRTLLITLLIFTANIASAQWVDSMEQCLDINLKEIDFKKQPKEYAYFRVAYKAENGYWRVRMYYFDTKSLRFEGTFSEYIKDSFQVREGLCTEYYRNGNVRSTGKFLHDTKVGLHRSYYYTGIPMDSTFYKINGMPYHKSYEWSSNGSLRFYGEYDPGGSGAGNVTGYYKDSIVKYIGQYAAGHHRDSIWSYYNKDGSLLGIDVFDNGELLSYETYDSTGAKVNCENDSLMPDPVYNVNVGLAKNIRYPMSAVENDQEGTAHINFTVSEEGVLEDFYIEKSTGYYILDNEAMRVIKLLPKWSPGLERCRPVRVSYTLPVTFMIGFK